MAAEIPPHALEQTAPRFDLNRVETPAYVVDLGLLRQNLEKLAMVQRESGCKVLLALKGFSMFSTFGLVRQYLSGCCASGLHEALLAHEEFGKEVHVYAPAFKDEEMRQIIPIAHHISFNSPRQWHKFRPMIEAAKARGHAPSPGLRVNPEHSEVEVSLYDPCSPGCRLGTRDEALEGEDLSGLEGLHFHALCEQNSDTLERVVGAVEKRFPKFLEQVKWVNMGGGHHITRNNYDVDRLIKLIQGFKQRWGKEVYLEPGEAIALNTGYLVASVLDMVGEKKRSPVAISTADSTIKNHGQGSTHSFRYRTAADSVGAARALIECLENAPGRTDSADAAQRINSETESLLGWAQKSGWLIEHTALARYTEKSTELEGASEHDVYLDNEAGRVLKLTKPPNFGARGEAKAYLGNVLACRLLLGVDWRLEGVVTAPDGLRILTSQGFIQGERASDAQIESWFAALGFLKVRENTYQNSDGISVADARPDNIFRDAK
ncbi:MAG: Carboxynorspermidine decarboxylase, partial [Verrucomicrobiaceae bacterium]|nr:Carboxynorspermidine decarboxylase [Verrucomicrobiaceae bacterium]